MKHRVCPQAKREDRVRAEFQAAAAREGCSAAQVLRELMEMYVEMQRNAAGMAAKRRHGLERCTAALVVCPEPWRAARLVNGEQMELEARADRQHGWRSRAYARGEH